MERWAAAIEKINKTNDVLFNNCGIGCSPSEGLDSRDPSMATHSSIVAIARIYTCTFHGQCCSSIPPLLAMNLSSRTQYDIDLSTSMDACCFAGPWGEWCRETAVRYHIPMAVRLSNTYSLVCTHYFTHVESYFSFFFLLLLLLLLIFFSEYLAFIWGHQRPVLAYEFRIFNWKGLVLLARGVELS